MSGIKIIAIFVTCFVNAPLSVVPQAIDRQSLVTRHNVNLTRPDPLTPLSVGNGEFAFTADITGLQTFPDYHESGMPLGTQSNWGWHTLPSEEAGKLTDVLEEYTVGSRKVPYAEDGRSGAYSPAGAWLRANPHRLHLGRIGLTFRLLDRRPVLTGLTAPEKPLYVGAGLPTSPYVIEDHTRIEDIGNPTQTLDLWTGLLTSRFEVHGAKVTVETVCHPEDDTLAVRVASPLLTKGGLAISLGFPYGADEWRIAADWNHPHLHRTGALHDCITSALPGRKTLKLMRTLDDDHYYVAVACSPEMQVRCPADHQFEFWTSADSIEAVFAFSPKFITKTLPEFAAIKAAAADHWQRFWTSGGAIDFSACTDPRAAELERRVVLSQYLTAIQCAGSRPPQETGLVCNSWHGKFHLEMHWWHAAHFALWNRPFLLERSLWWYQSIHSRAKEIAADQGYAGARWPKMVGPEGDQSPSPIAPLLIWQQPHPIFLAELCYRARRDASVLQVYREIVFDSAEFMASFAHCDEAIGRYVLGPPVIPAQENHKPEITINPAFELRYWRFGLDLAQRWRERLGLPRKPAWDQVLSKLSQMPVREGVYLAHENCPNTFESFNYDHPSMLGAYGVLPEDPSIDPEIMRSTLERTIKDWRWERTWGWDYPMCAMAAARLGQARTAIDMLLFDSVKNRYMVNGHVWQRPNLPLYLPANGGLLVAIAMMAAGWDGLANNERVGRGGGAGQGSGDGSSQAEGRAKSEMSCRHAPGFPDDGTWKVSCERILPYV